MTHREHLERTIQHLTQRRSEALEMIRAYESGEMRSLRGIAGGELEDDTAEVLTLDRQLVADFDRYIAAYEAELSKLNP